MKYARYGDVLGIGMKFRGERPIAHITIGQSQLYGRNGYKFKLRVWY